MKLATRGFGAVGAGAERTRQTRFGIWAAVARRNGYSDDVVKLLEEHVDAKFPLHAAAKAGDVGTMSQLLDDGAKVDEVANGRTALSIACENGQVDAAKLLLDRGADLGRLTRVASGPEDSASAPNVSPVSP